jgi:hypothetical protein
MRSKGVERGHHYVLVSVHMNQRGRAMRIQVDTLDTNSPTVVAMRLDGSAAGRPAVVCL